MKVRFSAFSIKIKFGMMFLVKCPQSACSYRYFWVLSSTYFGEQYHFVTAGYRRTR